MISDTLPETNSLPMKIPMFPCKYYQNGGFSMAMLVLGRVNKLYSLKLTYIFAPETGWLEYDCFLLGWPIFGGLCC